jgi:acetolactate synthase-1/2/3 large subunit
MNALSPAHDQQDSPRTATASGAEVLLRALNDQGVDVIFGYPGGAVLPIYDALFQQNAIRHILVRHEQAAVHAAEGYARSTGKVGVVLVTSGPGATNAVTGLLDALMDSVPLVCLTGQVPTHLRSRKQTPLGSPGRRPNTIISSSAAKIWPARCTTRSMWRAAAAPARWWSICRRIS